MTIVPLGDKVVVKRLEPPGMSKGGIVLPDNAQRKPQQGTVIAVGDGRLLPDGTKVALTVKAGDRVLFSHYVGADVVVDDVELLVISESEILGRIIGDKK